MMSVAMSSFGSEFRFEFPVCGVREPHTIPFHSLITIHQDQIMQSIVRLSRAPLALTALTLALVSCKGDSITDPAGESEVITRVTLTLTPTTGAAISAFIEDADGNGPNPPSAQVGTLNLPAGSTFTGAVRFENRTVTPVEDITAEVLAEANEHRVFYTVTGAGITVNSTDLDGAGRPLGLRFTAAAVAGTQPGARTLRVLLCHYDKQVKPAVAASCTVDTDIDVSFALSVPNIV